MSSTSSGHASFFRANFSPRAGYAVSAVVAAAGWMIHSLALLNHDVAWFLIAAGRMLDGGSYLRDFFEVNMPLAIATYIPVLGATHLLGLSLQAAMTSCVCVLALQSAFLSSHLLSSGPAPLICRALAPWFSAWLLLGLLFMPGYNSGQREHLIVLLCLPWVSAVANHECLSSLPTLARIYITLLAAIGFFLKPYYAGLPFLLLGAAGAARRSWAPLCSLEMVVLLLVAAADGALVVLRYPDWFTVARWAADLYIGYGRQGGLLRVLFSEESVVIVLLCLALQSLVHWRVRAVRRLLGPFILSACYSCLAYAVQQKGWYYQFIATMLFAWAGQMLTLTGCLLAKDRRLQGRLMIGGTAVASLTLIGVAVGDACNMPKQADLLGLPQILSAEPPGEYVYALSVEVWPFLPAIPLAGLNWGSRFSPLWPLVKLTRAEHLEGAPSAARLERTYRAPLVSFVVEDFKRFRPGLVIVDHTNDEFDVKKNLLADRDFASMWQGYALAGTIKSQGGATIYEIYRRSATPVAAAE